MITCFFKKEYIKFDLQIKQLSSDRTAVCRSNDLQRIIPSEDSFHISMQLFDQQIILRPADTSLITSVDNSLNCRSKVNLQIIL